MRIALLSTFGPEVRGISYYSDCLLAALQLRASLEVVAVDYDKVYPDWLHPAGKAKIGKTAIRTVHYGKPWTWRADRQQPELIHLQSWTAVTSLIHLRILTAARKRGVPTVLTVHNPTSHEKQGLSGRLEQRCLHLADRIVLHDDCGLESIPDSCRPKVRIIPHGTEVLELGEEDLQGVNQQAPYLLYFGNIRPYKGVELLLSAWQACADRFPQVSLVVAGQLWQGKTFLSRLTATMLGTANHSRQILQLAKDPHLERVEFRLEFIDDQDLDKLIRGARYTIFPYLKFSGHSGAVSRSAANGTPVLVSDVGGLPSLAVGAENIFSAGSEQDLSELLVRKLQSTDIDFDERARQLSKARSLSWDHAAELHEKLYQELCAESSAGT